MNSLPLAAIGNHSIGIIERCYEMRQFNADSSLK